MHPFIAALPRDPRTRIDAIRGKAAELRGRGIDSLNDSELTLVEELAPAHDDAAKRLKFDSDLAAFMGGHERRWEAAGNMSGGPGERVTAVKGSETFEPRAAQAAAFTGAMRKAFDGLAGGVRTKSGILPSAGTAVGFDYAEPLIASPRGPLTIADLVSRTATDAPSGTLLVQDTRTNSAASVVIGQVKPTSSYTLVPRPWRVATIAHTVTVPRQYVADYAGLTDFIGAEMSFGLAAALDAAVLQGTTDEEGGTVPGLLTTTGMLTTAFQSDALTSIRVAVGSLENAGVDATAIAMNPTDWQTVELLRENGANGGYLLGDGPAARAPRTLWGLPVVVSLGIPTGKALIGDFRRAVLMDRQAVELVVFESGLASESPVQDLASRNLLRFRGELRAAPLVQLPSAFRVVSLAAS